MGRRAAPGMENAERAITRPHHFDSSYLRAVFAYVNLVAAVAAYVSITHGVRNSQALDTLIYHLVKDAAFGADITQTAIRRGCAAAKNIHEAEMAPNFKNGVIICKAGTWRLKPLANMYLVEAQVGSRANPIRIRFLIPKRVGDMLQKYRLGELLITPAKYTITYSKAVKAVRELEPQRNPVSIIELTSGVRYLQDEHEPLIAVDMNSYGAMSYDGTTITKYDFTKRVDDVMNARTSKPQADEWRAMKDNSRYKKKHGTPRSNRKRDGKRAKQKMICGGNRLAKKLDHRIRNIGKKEKSELKSVQARQAAETRKLKKLHLAESDLKRRKADVKAKYGVEKAAVREKYAKEKRELQERRAKCITDEPRKPPVNNNERQRRASNASNALDDTLHVAACSMVAHALATGSAIILEDLTGMSRGWVKFNKRTRNRLNAAAMLKFQRLIYEKARWHGVEVIWMHPRNTSALCCSCKTCLTGDYSYRTCRHCAIRVDRDVNAVFNMLRTTAAARYGQPRVWPSPNEARALPDIILDHVRVIHEGGSLRVDGENGEVRA